jgi:hypothetical protein
MARREQRTLGATLDNSDITSSPEENSKFKVGDDLYVLLDEVLNNATRAILVYDEFSGRFTDMDACALASVLRYNTSLIAVNMCGVEIGDHSVSLLCDALARSKVRVLDLSNTFLAEEAGAALAALAHCNPNLRTVIVDDTLIPEEMMDEIDLACTNNDTLYEVGAPSKIDPDRPRYCVQHCFGACPDGEFCSLTHRSISLIGKAGDDAAMGASAGAHSTRPLELPPVPKEGATWRAPKRVKHAGESESDGDDADEMAKESYAPRLASSGTGGGSRKGGARGTRKGGNGGAGDLPLPLVVATVGLCVATLALVVAIKLRMQDN